MKKCAVKRAVSLVLACAALGSVVSLGASAADRDPVVVVSLGDSYSSGEGIPAFYGQDKAWEQRVYDEDWLAHRSTKSWPGLLEFAGVSGIMKIYNVKETNSADCKWYFGASSGAETKHINKQTQEKKTSKRMSLFKTMKTTYQLPKQLDLLESAARRYETYATQLAREHPDFLLNGEGFSDIATKYNNLRTSDLQRLSGQVTMNALSVDQERIASQYENQIKVLEISLKELAQEAEDIKAMIGNYSRDDIIYVSTTGSLQQISGNTATYDTLVAEQKKIEDQFAEKNKELIQTQLKLADIRGEEAPAAEPAAEGEDEDEADIEPIVISEEERAAQKAAVEKGIASAVRKLNQYTDEFSAFLKAYSDREMNDGTVALTPVRYDAPKLLSGAFVKQAVKTAGPICVLGFIVCLVLIIRSRMKEEKEKA